MPYLLTALLRYRIVHRMSNSTNITITSEHAIDAPADTVWRVIADYARDPEWRTGVISMVPSPTGTVRVGTTTVEHLRLAGREIRTEGEVTDVVEGRWFSWRTTAGAEARGSRTVEALGPDRCRLRLELTVTPHGVERVLAPVLRRMLQRNLGHDLDQLDGLARAADRRGFRSAAGR
jgi:uncharacterized protein YndB with AHSA1/START domain